jgi:hypothetical protein
MQWRRRAAKIRTDPVSIVLIMIAAYVDILVARYVACII